VRTLWNRLHRLIHWLDGTELEAERVEAAEQLLAQDDKIIALLKEERNIWQRRAMALDPLLQRAMHEPPR